MVHETEQASAVLGKGDQRRVLSDREGHHDARALPVLGEIADARRDSIHGPVGAQLLPRHSDPACGAAEAHHGFRHLGAARPHETRQPQDLTRPDGEGDALEGAGRGEVLNLEKNGSFDSRLRQLREDV